MEEGNSGDPLSLAPGPGGELLERWLETSKSVYSLISALSSMGKSRRWGLTEEPAPTGEPSPGKGFLELRASTHRAVDENQVAFRKSVTYQEDPRFAGGPHLEHLVDEPRFIAQVQGARATVAAPGAGEGRVPGLCV